jgi:hypothetical protein
MQVLYSNTTNTTCKTIVKHESNNVIKRESEKG